MTHPTTTLRIRNWEKFQHYKDRNPPWIKLHFELLTSRDWVTLDDASRVLAVACMLVASRTEGDAGTFEADPDYVQRVAYLNTKPNFKPLIQCGFLETLADASNMLASARPETETETETDLMLTPDEVSAPVDNFPGFWNGYPRKIGRKKAAIAWKKLSKKDQLAALGALEGWPFSHDPQYQPHPATWLAQRRWEDEPDPPPTAAKRGNGRDEPAPRAGVNSMPVHQAAPEPTQAERESQAKLAREQLAEVRRRMKGAST